MSDSPPSSLLVKSGNLFLFRAFYALLVHLDRTIRTHPKTQTARRTTIGVADFRIGKTLIIEIDRHAKYLLWAKQDTHPAPLTAMLIKVNFIHLVPYNSTSLTQLSYGQRHFGSTQFVKRHIPVLPNRFIAMRADYAGNFFGASAIGDLKLLGSTFFTGISAGTGF